MHHVQHGMPLFFGFWLLVVAVLVIATSGKESR
jgi:hypothetical protein